MADVHLIVAYQENIHVLEGNIFLEIINIYLSISDHAHSKSFLYRQHKTSKNQSKKSKPVKKVKTSQTQSKQAKPSQNKPNPVKTSQNQIKPVKPSQNQIKPSQTQSKPDKTITKHVKKGTSSPIRRRSIACHIRQMVLASLPPRGWFLH